MFSFLLKRNHVVHEFRQVRPEQLLAHVPLAAAADAHDAGLFPQRFNDLLVVGADALVFDQPRDQVHLFDTRVLAQGAGQFHDVLGLPAGVGIASQLQIVPADQSVDAEQLQVKLFLLFLFLFCLYSLLDEFSKQWI
jgi:hypothetical protein